MGEERERERVSVCRQDAFSVVGFRDRGLWARESVHSHDERNAELQGSLT